MHILPISAKRKINSIKSDLIEYHRPSTVFPEEKLEKRVKVIHAVGFLALFAAAMGAMVLKKRALEFPQMNMTKFKKHGDFSDGIAKYKGEPYNGKIFKYDKDGCLNRFIFRKGKLRDIHVFDVQSPGPARSQRRWISDIDDLRLKTYLNAGTDFRTVEFDYSGKVTHNLNRKIERIVEPLEDNQIRLVNFENGKPVTTIGKVAPNIKH